MVGEPEAMAFIESFKHDHPTLPYTKICNLWKEFILADTIYGAACILKYKDDVLLHDHLDSLFIQHC
jgi:hypothetical protein